MKNRRVWSVEWRLSSRKWVIVNNMSFNDAARLFAWVWVAGVREVNIWRRGVVQK